MQTDWTRERLEKEIIGYMKVETIPVNHKIHGSQRILDFSEVESLLKQATLIGQSECGCRKEFKKCIEPMDGCLSFDEEAVDFIEKGLSRAVSVEEALEALKRTHNAGLVHMAYTMKGQEKVGIVCSCCSCCCHSLSAAVRFNYPNHVLTSRFISTHNTDLCIECGQCTDLCQFKARTVINEKLVFNRKKCFGCGLCLDCPEEAISLVER